jgi:hypothetical protein
MVESIFFCVRLTSPQPQHQSHAEPSITASGAPGIFAICIASQPLFNGQFPYLKSRQNYFRFVTLQVSRAPI